MRGAIRRAGSRNFWELSRRNLLRPETRNYIPKIIAAALIAKQAETYGFRTTSAPIATFDIAYVPDATSLDVVARAAGVGFDEILALNHHLVRGITPPGERYPVRLPAGTPRIFAENYARIPATDRVSAVVHIVRPGDTLGRIADLYGVQLAVIREANDGLEPRKLWVGRRLIIPSATRIPALAD